MKKLLVLALALTLVGCVPVEVSDGGVPLTEYGVLRYTDEEAGVVCWLYYTKSIDCMPISDTLLGE